MYNAYIDSSEVIRRLEREGWMLVRVRGSHHRFAHPDKPDRKVTVPHPKKDLVMKTLRSIYRQAGWEWR